MGQEEGGGDAFAFVIFWFVLAFVSSFVRSQIDGCACVVLPFFSFFIFSVALFSLTRAAAPLLLFFCPFVLVRHVQQNVV